ncbi:MAG: DNA replication/repair protein RecF [Bdellovibrionales bacterium]
MPYRVTRLALTHFRSYAWLELTPGPASVALAGPNGTGKTNILEAISLLIPGRGLRRAELSEVKQMTAAAEQPWGIVAAVEGPEGTQQLATGRETSADNEKRTAQLNNNPASISDFADYIALSWLTPEMDRMLAEGPGDKRRFFDRLVAAFDPAHTGRLTRYEKQLRERVALLTQPGGYDHTWMETLEDELAATAVAIAAARMHLMQALNEKAPGVAGQFPCVDLRIKHGIEIQLRDNPALTVEDNLRATFVRTRGRDAQYQTVEAGAHRTDIQAFYTAKNTPAEMCSTGEQKALMITLLLTHASLVAEARGAAPILLLDEVASHLDSARRQALFTSLHALGAQVWMTGVETGLFKGFPGPLVTYQIGVGSAKKVVASAA